MEDGTTRHRTTNRTAPREPKTDLEQYVDRLEQLLHSTWKLQKHVEIENGYTDVVSQQYTYTMV